MSIWAYLITYCVVIAVSAVVAVAVVIFVIAVVASMCVLNQMRQFPGESGKVGHYGLSTYIVQYTLSL